MKFQEAIEALKFKRERRYIVSGDDTYYRDQFLKAVRYFHADDTILAFDPESSAAARETLVSPCLFGERVVILRDAEHMGVESLIGPADGTVVVELSEGANLRTRRVTGLIALGSHVQIHKMKEYGDEYPAWIRARVRRNGYEFQDRADELVYHLVGPDLFSISNELEKLMVFKQGTKVIEASDVRKVVSRTASSTAYDILDLMLRRDVSGALTALDSYSRYSDSFIELVAFLAAYLEKFYRILLMVEKKTDPEVIAGIIGMHPYILKTRYLSRVVSMGRGLVGEQYDRLCALDARLREYRGDKRVLMERYLMGFAR